MPNYKITNRKRHNLTRGGIDVREYERIHKWIGSHWGNAKLCELCEGLNAKRFEWALKKGRSYSRERQDYIMMCVSCHRKYDMTDAKKKKLSKYFTDNPSFSVPVIQFDLDGNELNRFSNMTVAARSVNRSSSSIRQCLSGISNTSGGFKWEYDK